MRPLLCLSTSLVLIPLYFVLFYSIAHLRDSYKSYVKVDCFHYSTDTCIRRSCTGKGPNTRCTNIEYDCGYQWEFDFKAANLCEDEMEINSVDNDYVFKGSYKHYGGNNCFVNKDTFEFRGNDGGCLCCKEAFGRCGYVDCGDDGSCLCLNCAGYIFCIIPTLICIVFYCVFVYLIMNDELGSLYTISPINSHDILV